MTSQTRALAVMLWFRSDLRLMDNEAVTAALNSGLPVLPVYIHDDNFPTRPLGAASKWWLERSLKALMESLEKLGAELILRSGDTTTTLKHLISENNIKTIYCSRTFDPKSEAFDRDIPQTLGIEFKAFNTHLISDPAEILTGEGRSYRVFTPFSKAVIARGYTDLEMSDRPLPKWPIANVLPTSESLDSLALKPRLTASGKDWSKGFDIWTPGEHGARTQLKQFISKGLSNYAEGRDRPDLNVTSKLSAHLRFGEISPHRILHEVRQATAHHPELRTHGDKFRAELIWRDFSYNLLAQQNDLNTVNFKPEFNAMPWENNAKAFRAWCRGETGYSLVDAGMRELWQTGIMHNRVRMVCASFLIKHLMIDWREGEKWFWDTLVDADPANNPASWQWVAGSGADAAPYFRIFNPITQAEKFDPKGTYRRKYISGFTEEKSSAAPVKNSPKTFERDLFELMGEKVSLSTYPQPIVDHSFARDRALKAYERLKQET